jgi:hypothetical protein
MPVDIVAPAHTLGKTDAMKKSLFAAFATLALAAAFLASPSAAQTPPPRHGQRLHCRQGARHGSARDTLAS